MFLELTRSAFEKLKPKLESSGIGYQSSSCSIDGETNERGNPFECVHLEFGDIPVRTAKLVASFTDECYKEVAKESET